MAALKRILKYRHKLYFLCISRQGNDKFWKMHDFLFEHQSELNADNIMEQVGLAATHIKGVNIALFDECLDANGGNEVVEADVELADKLRIASTPTLWVNAHPVAGVVTAEQLKTLVRQARAEIGRKAPAPLR